MLNVFTTGVKESLQFKWAILGNVFSSFISLFLLASVWTVFFPRDYLPYFIGVYLILPSFQVYSYIAHEYANIIMKGWDLTMAKPANTFLIKTLYMYGTYAPDYLINLVIGTLTLYFFNINFNLPVVIVSLPFILIFEMALAYFITSFSYFFYTTWGIRVLLRLLDTVFGGFVFPLYLLSEQGKAIVFSFPFAHKCFFVVDGMLNNYIPFSSYINLVLWSMILFIIAFPLHKKGWKKFEGLGG